MSVAPVAASTPDQRSGHAARRHLATARSDSPEGDSLYGNTPEPLQYMHVPCSRPLDLPPMPLPHPRLHQHLPVPLQCRHSAFPVPSQYGQELCEYLLHPVPLHRSQVRDIRTPFLKRTPKNVSYPRAYVPRTPKEYGKFGNSLLEPFFEPKHVKRRV